MALFGVLQPAGLWWLDMALFGVLLQSAGLVVVRHGAVWCLAVSWVSGG